MSEAQGGKFINGFASGALSSLAIKLLAGNNPTNDTLSGGGRCFEGGAAALGITNNEVKTVLYGAVGGAIGAAVTKGNIWEGVIIGATIASFNDLMHGKYAMKYNVTTHKSKEAASGFEHEAISFELENGSEHYFSMDGAVGGGAMGEGDYTAKILPSFGDINKYYNEKTGYNFDKVNVFRASSVQIQRGIKYALSVVNKDYNVLIRNCTQFVQSVLSKTYNMPLSILLTSKFPTINFQMEKIIYHKYYKGTIDLNSPYFVEQRRPLFKD